MRELLRAGSAFLALALLAYPFTLTGFSRGYIALSVPVLLLVLSGLALWSDGAVTLAAVALVVPYVTAIAAEDSPVDVLAPAVAALLAVFVVVADTAVAVPPGTPVDLRFARRLAVRCATVAVAAVTIGALVLVASALPVRDSQLVRSAGVAAAALALAAPIWLLARPSAAPAARRKRWRTRP